jgi:hypothetical protein
MLFGITLKRVPKKAARPGIMWVSLFQFEEPFRLI